jgi:hypothetical protein
VAASSGLQTVLVATTSNSYALNVTFDVSALLHHARTDAGASLTVGVFGGGSASSAFQALRLLPPWDTTEHVQPSTPGLGIHAVHNKTDTRGGAVLSSTTVGGWTACRDKCVGSAKCTAWTLKETPISGPTCQLKAGRVELHGNIGAGCGALAKDTDDSHCTSGLVAWQLALPDIDHPVIVVPTAEGKIRVELFVDQQICEAFIRCERGALCLARLLAARVVLLRGSC